jgi:hypothetical protein
MAVGVTTATLQVQVSESSSVGDLKSYLEATECEVQVVDTHTLESRSRAFPSPRKHCVYSPST